MKVSNRGCIRRLSLRSLLASRTRNIVTVLAIALTAVLFTSLFTIALSINEGIQQNNFRQAGGWSHGSFKYLTEEQFHELKDESKAQRASATRFLTNFYRLLLSALAYTIFVAIRLKIFSRFEYKGRWWNVSVERMRRALLNIAGLVKLGQRKIEVEIQSALMDEPAFWHFWQYRIS